MLVFKELYYAKFKKNISKKKTERYSNKKITIIRRYEMNEKFNLSTIDLIVLLR